MFLLALAAVLQEAPATTLLKDARVHVKPGVVLERASILLRDGKVAAVGDGIVAPEGATVVDCAGLQAYAGFVHPAVRVSGAAAAEEPEAGTPAQRQQTRDSAEAMRQRDADPLGRKLLLLAGEPTSRAKVESSAQLDALANNGYGLAQVGLSGGILGRTTALYDLGGKGLDPGMVVRELGNVPVNFSARGGGGYPSSTMGAVAFVRQALLDAGWRTRRKAAGATLDDQPGLDALTPGRLVFDDLTEVNYYTASNVFGDASLPPILGFRSGAGALASRLVGKDVMLRGDVPSKPSLEGEFGVSALSSVRAYFNESQAGAELDRAGIPFAYAPASIANPLAGIRAYVGAGLSRSAALAAMTTVPAKLLKIEDLAGTIEVGKRADIALFQGDCMDSSSQVMAVFTAGKRRDFKMPERKAADKLVPDEAVPMMKPNYSLFPRPAESEPAFRLYRNATVWTMGPQGVMQGSDVLIRDGKIIEVGRRLAAPSGCEVVDATGKHISPGIWDCHSHTGINGGVNEGTNMVTIECRISDVVNHQSGGIYQQLAGGTVGANQLHGSANAIGGQNHVVKWRWGLPADQFTVRGAPPGVKFALGQNPIREDSTGGGATPIGTTLLTWRPRTRMGVEESIRRALQLGKEYNDEWAAFRSGASPAEPRRDLQLEALGEVVAGTRWVHSHAYRADEMLGLIRLIDEFGGKLATLQHSLEGYKIADELAEAGVGGSTFADWWGFKLEAYDAVPFNPALMAERGVSVSVNSDSGDHARRLNLEAAKSIRYGGTSPEKALSFVTIEPCRQLGIDSQTGSVEAGKTADLVVWSADPTSTFAVCLETYVDGVKRFDRADDSRQRDERLAELGRAKDLLGAKPASPATPPANAEPKAASTAKFGIGPVRSQPGSLKYPRTATLIAGATVHPMVGDPFVGDVLLGADGRIASVGRNLGALGAARVDGRGKHLYPGLIDPITTLGMAEIGQVPASDDSSERGSFHPDYRVERAMNPEWETFGVARHQGVLTALVRPGGSGASGQAALIHTEGFTWEDITVQGGVALAFSAGGGQGGFGQDERCLCEQMGEEHHHDEEFTSGAIQESGQQAEPNAALRTLKRLMDESLEYAKSVRAATPDKPVPRNMGHEAMLLVATGKLPVMLSVNSAADIKSTVAWAESEGVRVVLYGCSGAGEIAEWLAEKQVPICLAAVYNTPNGELPTDHFYGLPAKLSKAGVRFCLTTNSDKDVRQLRDQAGWAAAYGVDREEAARLVTLRAAEVLGIEGRLGSIQPGLDGTVILTDGEIIETKTKVLRAWIQGREVSLENKQTRLYEKYRARPKPKRAA
ncbi:MAG: amidohydrolase family protein [Fimbriimonadaceae bacterium]